VVGDYLLDDSEAQSSSQPSFCSEQRIEYKVNIVPLDAFAAVGEVDFQRWSPLCRRDRQHTPPGHCIEAVIDQVYEDLLKLIRIRFDWRQSFGHVRAHVNAPGRESRLRCV